MVGIVKDKVLLLDKIIISSLGIYMALVMIFDSRPEITNVINLFFVAYFILSLLAFYKSKRLIIDTFLMWFYLFGIALLIGVLFAPVSDYAIMICTTYLSLSIFLFINIKNMRNKKLIEKTLFVLTIAGLVNSLYSVYFYGVDGIINSITNGIRLGWEISSPNSYGLYSAFTALLLIYFYFYKGKKIYLILAILPIIIMFTSYSKKAFLVLAFSIILLVIYKYRKKSIKMIGSIFLVLAVIYIVLQAPALELLKLRLESMFSVVTNNDNNTSLYVDGSDQKREELILIGINFFEDSPIVGNGTGAYRFKSEAIFGMSTASHNNFIEIAVNHGLIGLFLYYTPIFIILISLLFHSLNKNDEVAFLIFILLFVITFIHGMSAITYTDKFYWFLISIGVSYHIYVIKPEKTLQDKLRT